MLGAILAGFSQLLSINIMALILLGSFIGMVFGFIPGLNGTVALAIFIPFVFGMPINMSMAFLLGMHASVMFGGSISAILFNVPGTSQNIATCFDGYPMSQNGEAAKAIGIAGTSSLIGGLFGAVVLALFLPLIRPFILAFGPAELFMLIIFGLSMIALLTADTIVKGLIAGGLGLLVSFIGLDYITGAARYTFGYLELWDGINFVPVAIGLFAIAQMIDLYIKGGSIAERTSNIDQSTVREGIKYTFSKPGLLLRSSVLGTIIGMIPGVGGTVANILAYGHAMQTSKEPDKFSKGNPEGIVGPEAANNAKEGGALIPTLAFGIPGSQGMAILLGAFIMIGIVPGPEMVTKHLDIVFMLVFIVVIGNIFATGIGLISANKLQKLTVIPGKQLVPIILAICLIGSFVTNRRFSDVIVALIFAILGYFMKKYGYSRAAFIIALVLGTLFERYYHITVRLYGSFFIFKRPISLILLILVIISITIPFVQSKKSKDIRQNIS
jgi:TctA family transporter